MSGGTWRIGNPVYADPQGPRHETIHGPAGLIAFVEIVDGCRADLELMAEAPALLEMVREQMELIRDLAREVGIDAPEWRRALEMETRARRLLLRSEP